ncbi:transcriptional regulator, GntR family with aminotransferase domain [Catenulispora acidiphila DSM 44928]|uniref:Transcriptional regulator, GntR family with aminotransferase domain n=1 Tax=Catenulispora acidiphila (strain DSM 44928 / JCM 14897 / NBRC 102108 / NRRL B-24433 / ID139908) TaxID=479433 RepID=C7Q3V7_CATAD|nr:PLP-dependent aminotransferase family protein [Catenulispora acidiphila]ACU77715.1 transcriptional regulator, GntR family with aminotransferase domain [Catenulispora acidiphila DSM 44928]
MAEYWSTLDVDLHLAVDPASGRRVGLEQALREAIRDGRLAAGTRLPSTRTLAAELGLARGTVSAAYDQLVAEGHLVAVRGSGTHVADLGSRVGAPLRPSAAGAASAAEPAGSERPWTQPLGLNLRPGSPDLSFFPRAAWLRAARRALNAAPNNAFGYGDPRGRIELRQALAEYLGRARGVRTDPERIVIVSGAVQGLALLAQVLGGAVAMENPYIPLFHEVVRTHGAEVVPLPVDEDGARVDLLSRRAFDGVDTVVVTPSHQYPIGSTLHPARRQALVEWAREGRRLVVEDDYDGEFRYDRQPVGALQGMAPDRTVYLGTASKTLGPGIRLAWMALPEHLVGPLTEAKRHADHQTESLGQLTLAEFIASHDYDRQVRAARLRYRRRRDLLAERLHPRAGRPAAGFALGGIAAGLHALVRLEPAGMTEAEVLRRAAESDLDLEGLGDLWHTSPTNTHASSAARPQGIVVGFGSPTEAAYPRALDALVRTLSWR